MYIEDDIKRLEDKVDDLTSMMTNLVKAIRPYHTEDCVVIKNKDKITNKEFTIDNNGYAWFCYCNNKKKHNKKCIPHLKQTLENMCNCGYKEIQKVLRDY